MPMPQAPSACKAIHTQFDLTISILVARVHPSSTDAAFGCLLQFNNSHDGTVPTTLLYDRDDNDHHHHHHRTTSAGSESDISEPYQLQIQYV